MESLSLYFAKYQNIGVESKTTKNILKEVLFEVCGVEIDTKQIKIERDSIKINIDGPAKSQILINKNKISSEFLERLEKRGFKKTAKKII